MLRIKSGKITDGIRVSFRGKGYDIVFPKGTWSKLHCETQEALLRNLAHVTTIHLPIVFDEKKILYNTGFPIFSTLFYQNMIYDIPSCTMFNGHKASDVIRDFINVDFEFGTYDATIPSQSFSPKNRVVIPFTFGKDSLLTYAICSELGLEKTLVNIEEPAFRYERLYKKELAKKFSREQKQRVEFIVHKTGMLRDMDYLGTDLKEFGWGHQTTEYSLLMVPFVIRDSARLVLFGNEQDNNYYILDEEGYICYPSFDQSSSWTMQQDSMLRILTGNSAGVASFLEPLNDVAILKVLHRRYPGIAKYQMSCFSDSSGARWCHHCSKCARMYINMLAAGANPKTIGMKNMLGKKFRNYYSIFSGSKLDGFDASAVAADEQMFSFYLAYRNGARGYLIDEFKPLFLDEAKSREDELAKTYFKVHKPATIPQDLKKEILSIYREEI